MEQIVTCREMKALDGYTISQMGVPSLVLMERAAIKVTEEIMKIAAEKERILVVCGSGNNGGDGIAIARLLFLKGCAVEIFMAGNPEKMTEETARQWKIAGEYQVPVTNNPVWDEYTIIVDAVFGVGLSRKIEGRYQNIISQINSACAKKVAVDIPSGINGDTGEILGCAVKADLTVTFAFRKRGLILYPGRTYGGEIKVADIGIYETQTVPVSALSIEEKDLSLLPERVPWGNKGTFGKVLVIAGSEGMCGAAYLSAYAALKAGAGMVKIQTVEANRVPLQAMAPELMVTCAFDEETNRRNLDWCDVLVIGPGIGTDASGKKRAEWFLKGAWEEKKPVVLDADGLNLLSVHKEWKQYLGEHVILTPHIGELGRLLGKSIQEIKADPVKAAAALSGETGCVCAAKDACTVITDSEGRLYLNLSGNAGMATAGSGDVLSGILGAVLCTGREIKELSQITKAALGVFLHGKCGDYIAQEQGICGMTAKDLLRALPFVLHDIRRKLPTADTVVEG